VEIFSKITRLFSNNTAAPVMPSRPVVMPGSDNNIIEDSAMSMVHVINESLKIANESTNYDTRVSRAQVAKNTLSKLKEFVILYPDIFISSLSDAERSIEAVENETRTMKPIIPARTNIIPETAKEAIKSHNEYLAGIMADEDSVLSGAMYFATMQLRTPPWILQKDDEKWSKGDPPEVGEPWMGIWCPHIKTWKELGLKGMKEFPESDVASDIGPVNHKNI
jgi:hypothetical protein